MVPTLEPSLPKSGVLVDMAIIPINARWELSALNIFKDQAPHLASFYSAYIIVLLDKINLKEKK